MLQPWEAVISADCAHIVVDEAGAPSRFTGATMVPVAHDEGRLRPRPSRPTSSGWAASTTRSPAVVSITQATE